MENGIFSYTISSKDTDYKILVIHNQRDVEQAFALNVNGNDLYTGKDVSKSDTFSLQGNSTLIIKYNSDESPTNIKYLSEKDKPELDYTLKFIVTLPENTPNEDIYIVGTFNEWNPGDKKYVMTKTSPTTCEITLTLKAKEMTKMEYKYTRGNWDKREQNSKGQDLVGEKQLQNRVYQFFIEQEEIEDTIEKWSDIQ